jgi:hypothetical protein
VRLSKRLTAADAERAEKAQRVEYYSTLCASSAFSASAAVKVF